MCPMCKTKNHSYNNYLNRLYRRVIIALIVIGTFCATYNDIQVIIDNRKNVNKFRLGKGKFCKQY